MVAWFNKWLMMALLCGGFVSTTVVGPVAGAKPVHTPGIPHPLHLGVTEAEHNAADQTLEISCKLFSDDFERILEKVYDRDIDLINPSDRAAVQAVINDYIRKHLSFKVDGKAVTFTCIGFEPDHEATYSYFQAEGIKEVKKVEVTSTLMYDLFDDQTNIFHIKVNGKRKSSKLNYPAKVTEISFP
ncbi:MAG: hypothetical protein QM781_15125 [Chitinophagaceae bacterium]